ncbi:cytochrome-c peroxidase [Aquimarina algiphila]|uniref:Cytochrome-c peroxidase n=1 Tax=Aquimarina algiphila TaxID=2047982 RepID=A0A554VM85_9FLAO|nr:cytochrome c peroxidase [Aquimarina algiphila]TSE09348.1 cytochrome-c peroxidase [Aquimarina algiphila]
MKKNYFLILILVLISCNNDDYVEIDSDVSKTYSNTSNPTEQDQKLLQRLDSVTEGIGVSFFILPDSDDYVNIPQDPLNLITAKKVELGKLLFHETATGGNPKVASNKAMYSCASCHHAAAGFSAGIRQGIGEAGSGFGINGNGRIIDPSIPLNLVDIQPIRSPTILNVAYQDVMLWNGQFGGTGTNAGTEANWTNIPENFLGFEGVEIQAIKGQDVHRLLIDKDFVKDFNYKKLFNKAFPDVPKSERYTKENAALAIAAYERTVLPNQSPWQKWLKGDFEALTKKEKKGARVFFGKGKCFKCHTGPALNDKKFYAFGMDDFDNSSKAIVLDTPGFENVKKGRGGFTKKTKDNYKFKTPTLYNLIDNGFFGHGGTFTSVRDVIEYKINGTPQNPEVPVERLAKQFVNVQELTENQINNLTLFIENGLRDPNLARYVPNLVQSGFCIPNNDAESKVDLGCN